MRLAAQAVLAALLASPPAIRAQQAADPPSRDAEAARPLAVPFLPQSEALCGGASAAMVERYWGARGVQPRDFAALVDRGRGGIPTDVLVARLAADGWQAFALRGSLEILRHHLDLGRPVIALLEVAPEQRHYVVVVGVTRTSVVYHDPALLPDRSETIADFEAQWERTDRWMLLVLPRAGAHLEQPSPARARAPASADSRADAVPRLPASCATPLEVGVAMARNGEYDAARLRLRQAIAACRTAPDPLVELSSVELLDGQYASAIDLTRRALALDPTNPHAWRVLATAEYLRDRPLAALRAWNNAGTPRVDLIDIQGLTRTRYGSAERFLGLAPGALLTPRDLERATRRLGELPAVVSSRVAFDPTPGGYANLEAGVVERPLVPESPLEMTALAARAATDREVRWTFGSPTRNGEAITAAWRWWEGRQAAWIDARIPLAGAIHGVLGLSGGMASQSYASPAAGREPAGERRRFARASFSDWATPQLRWELRTGVDRWAGPGAFAMVGGGLDLRLAHDRVSIGGTADAWPRSAGFGSLSVEGHWRSSIDPSRVELRADAGAAAVSSRAPRDLWPGAGTGHARPALLRAHPLLDGEGVLSGEAFGTRLVHATVEGRVPVARLLLARVLAAAFVDIGRPWRQDGTGRILTDIGGGLRIGLPGSGTVRVDVARGLVDGANALSVAWEPPWPGTTSNSIR